MEQEECNYVLVPNDIFWLGSQHSLIMWLRWKYHVNRCFPLTKMEQRVHLFIIINGVRNIMYLQRFLLPTCNGVWDYKYIKISVMENGWVLGRWVNLAPVNRCIQLELS